MLQLDQGAMLLKKFGRLMFDRAERNKLKYMWVWAKCTTLKCNLKVAGDFGIFYAAPSL